MKVLVKNEWIDTPLDYATRNGQERIFVRFMLNISRVDDVYFQRKRDFRQVWNYILEIGVVHTLTKIVSRSAEGPRNEKYLSVGYGHIVTNGNRNAVYFIAPLHPACVDIISCDRALLHFSSDDLRLPEEQVKHIGHDSYPNRDTLLKLCGDLAGWSHYAGTPAPALDWSAIVAEIQRAAQCQNAQALSAPKRSPTTGVALPQLLNQKISATLFGYGNYAKTVIIPNLPPKIKITRIHEIDPLQLSSRAHRDYSCSTEPTLSQEDKNLVIFIAGYHHTHAEIAIEGLQRGLNVVVEKPLVTSREQLVALQTAYATSKGRYFSCFHKRYLSFNTLVRSDLGIDTQDPINYHAIVYEVPLPKRHWYRWPNSRSRLVSNGCHWIDHFLFLNNFCQVSCHGINSAPDGTINLSITLDNGAYFSMILTDIGSERLGVQDHVELRQNHTTIKIVNGAHYEAENSHRILRKLSANRMDSYRHMYQSIGSRICSSAPGDSWASIEVSSLLTLQAEESLNS